MILFILIEILLIGFCFFPVSKIGKRLYRYIFYLSNSFLLLYFNFHLINHPFLIEPTISIMRSISTPVKKYINSKYSNYYDPEFINNEFILIDTSNDLEIQSNNQNSNKTPITNRQKLTDLLNRLDRYTNNIQTIVCDIKIQQDLKKDTALSNIIDKLSYKKKIILTATENDEKINIATIKESNLPFGWVDYNLAEGYIFHVPLKTDHGSTLPYLLYETNKNTRYGNSKHNFLNFIAFETDTNEQISLINPSFVPEMYFSDSDLNKEIKDRKYTNLITILDLEEPSEYKLKNYVYDLSIVLDNPYLLGSLILNHKKSPIVFIGGFKQDEIDLHATAYGQMHGSLILINIYHALLKGQHKIEFIYLLYLFIAFMFLSMISIQKLTRSYEKRELTQNNKPQSNNFFLRKLLFYKMLQRNKRRIKKLIYTNKQISIIKDYPFLTYLYFLAESLFSLVFDSVFFISILIIVLISDILFDHIINILGLSIYFLIFSKLLNKIVDYEISMNDKK